MIKQPLYIQRKQKELLSTTMMDARLAGQWVGWMVSCLVGLSMGQLVGQWVGCLISWLFSGSDGWSVGRSAGQLVG